MKEIKHFWKERDEVKVYATRLFCNECGEEMKTKFMLPTHPPQYEHRCENDHRIRMLEQYPLLEYEKVKRRRRE